jgi:hypothetical protein
MDSFSRSAFSRDWKALSQRHRQLGSKSYSMTVVKKRAKTHSRYCCAEGIVLRSLCETVIGRRCGAPRSQPLSRQVVSQVTMDVVRIHGQS